MFIKEKTEPIVYYDNNTLEQQIKTLKSKEPLTNE